MGEDRLSSLDKYSEQKEGMLEPEKRKTTGFLLYEGGFNQFLFLDEA